MSAEKSVCLSSQEFQRIRDSAVVITEQEKEIARTLLDEQRKKLQEECEARKLRMQEIDTQRQKTISLDDAEEIIKSKVQDLLQKAKERHEEQEDEVKFLNELILSAKCQTIRDAQIREKQIVAKEMEVLQKNLDDMMEQRRLESTRHYLKKMETEERKTKMQLAALNQQIEEKQERKLIEEEQKEQERIQLIESVQNFHLKELEHKKKKKIEEDDLLKSLLEEINEAAAIRKTTKAKEKEEDLKLAEYVKKQQERETLLKDKEKKLRQQRDAEMAKQVMWKEKEQDMQKKRELLREKRNIEQAERDWRRKRKETEAKEKKMEDDLKKAHAEQILQKDHILAVQARREREEFERMLQRQIKSLEKEKETEEKQKLALADYSLEVKKQIVERELRLLNEKKKRFEDGMKLVTENEKRKEWFNKIKKKKLEELRSFNIPEQYIQEIERRVERQFNTKQ